MCVTPAIRDGEMAATDVLQNACSLKVLFNHQPGLAFSELLKNGLTRFETVVHQRK